MEIAINKYIWFYPIKAHLGIVLNMCTKKKLAYMVWEICVGHGDLVTVTVKSCFHGNQIK